MTTQLQVATSQIDRPKGTYQSNSVIGCYRRAARDINFVFANPIVLCSDLVAGFIEIVARLQQMESCRFNIMHNSYSLCRFVHGVFGYDQVNSWLASQPGVTWLQPQYYCIWETP